MTSDLEQSFKAKLRALHLKKRDLVSKFIEIGRETSDLDFLVLGYF